MDTTELFDYEELNDTDLLSKIQGVTKPGSKVEIHWNFTEQTDKGYIFTMPDNRWDEGDVFVHITDAFDCLENWVHMNVLLNTNLIKEIIVHDN